MMQGFLFNEGEPPKPLPKRSLPPPPVRKPISTSKMSGVMLMIKVGGDLIAMLYEPLLSRVEEYKSWLHERYPGERVTTKELPL